MNRSQAYVENILSVVSDMKYLAKSYSSREDWLKGRACSIGASEAAAVMGKSPWMNERQLWERKMGKLKESEGNADTMRGTKSEGHIRALYEIEMGTEVLDGTNIILRSIQYPFMTCSLDGIILHQEPIHSMAEPIIPTILEIKSVRQGGGDWSDTTIPNYYLIQILHQLAVTGWHEAKLLARFCMSDGWEKSYSKVYTFHREEYEEEIEKLIKKERRFWEDCVIAQRPPKVSVPMI